MLGETSKIAISGWSQLLVFPFEILLLVSVTGPGLIQQPTFSSLIDPKGAAKLGLEGDFL